MKCVRQSRLRRGPTGKGTVVEVELIELAGKGSRAPQYFVNLRTGREGHPRIEGTLTPLAVDLARAERIFERELQRRRAEGYLADGLLADEGPPPTSPAAPPLDDRAQRILAYLRDPQLAPADWRLHRIVYRAGELRIPGAAGPIAALLPSLQGRHRLSAAWALARLADPGAVGALRALRDPAENDATRRLATAGLLATPAAAQALRAELIDELPGAIGRAVGEEDPGALRLAVQRWLAEPAVDRPLVMVTLMLLDTAACRAVLLPWLQTTAFRPPSWRAVRRIFTLAILRDDIEIFALLTARFESTRANGSSASHSWMGPEGWVPNRTLLRRAETPFAYSQRTRAWHRLAAIRTLRRHADSGSERYVDLALAALRALPGDDRSLRPVVGHVLLSGALSPSGRRLKPWPSPPRLDAVRTERAPELWDARPDALLELAMGGLGPAAGRVGCRALVDRSDLAEIVPIAELVRLFSGGLPQQELALAAARAHWSPAEPSLPLLCAMVEAPSAAARALAHEWLQQLDALEHESLLIALLLSSHADSRALGRALLGAPAAAPAARDRVIRALLAALVAFPAEGPPTAAAVAELEALLTGELGAILQRWPLEELLPLLGAARVDLVRLGSRLVVAHEAPASAVPDEVLARWTASPDAQVRAEGVRVFGQLSDAVLMERFAVLLALAAAPEAPVRAELRPVIARLASRSADFENSMLHAILRALRSAEAAEGVHADLRLLCETALHRALAALPDATVLALLQADTAAAVDLGAARLSQLEPARLAPQVLVSLADHAVLEVRTTAQAWITAQPARVCAPPALLLGLIDGRWPETRALGARLLQEHVPQDALDPALLVAICDSPQPEVQAQGRRLIQQLFQTAHGPLLLARLSEHPAPEMQQFVSGLLAHHAGGQPERIAALDPYFRSVLLAVGRGRVARARAFAFLQAEALADRAVAEQVLPLLQLAAGSWAVGDRAKAIAALARIRRQWGLSPEGLRVHAPPQREGRHAL